MDHTLFYTLKDNAPPPISEIWYRFLTNIFGCYNNMRDVVICYAEAQDPSLQLPFLGKRGVAALFFVLFIPHMIMCDDEAQKETRKFRWLSIFQVST